MMDTPKNRHWRKVMAVIERPEQWLSIWESPIWSKEIDHQVRRIGEEKSAPISGHLSSLFTVSTVSDSESETDHQGKAQTVSNALMVECRLPHKYARDKV